MLAESAHHPKSEWGNLCEVISSYSLTSLAQVCNLLNQISEVILLLFHHNYRDILLAFPKHFLCFESSSITKISVSKIVFECRRMYSRCRIYPILQVKCIIYLFEFAFVMNPYLRQE